MQSARMPFLACVMCAAVALSSAHTAAAAGPVGVQVSGGKFMERGTYLAGVGARVGVAGFALIPNAEWLFVDDGSSYSINVDGTVNVLPLGAASGYVGGGIGWLTIDPDALDARTDNVFNVVAGLGLNVPTLSPFAQFKYVIADGDDPLLLVAGVRF